MNPQTVLGVAAGAQIVLLVAVYAVTWPSAPPAARPLTPLLAADATTVRVWDSPTDTEPDVSLVKGANGWELAGSGLAVDPARIDEVLRPLLEQPVRAPVSATATAWSSLGVADDGWIRKVQVDAGERSAVLVLGSGKETHVRVVGEDEVYTLDELKPWTIRATPWSWLPEPFHSLDPAQVVSLTVEAPDGTWSVSRPDPNGTWSWNPEDLATPLDPSKVESALDALSTVSTTGLPADPRAREPGTRVSWTLSDSTSGTLLLGANAGGQRWIFSEAKGYAILSTDPGLEPLASGSRTGFAPAPPEPEVVAP
jgi:hypothetical protein